MEPEQWPTMPEHSTTPLVRIAGQVIDRETGPGEPIPWRVATHVVCPAGTAQPLHCRTRLTDRTGHEILRSPDRKAGTAWPARRTGTPSTNATDPGFGSV